jgi:outer membrane protein assembly factor BamB
MNQDFVTRLELQLRQAERDQERRGRLGRALAGPRAHVPAPRALVGLAAAAAVAIATVLGAVALTRGGDEQTVGRRGPSVVARVALGDFPRGFDGGIASGFGAVWIAGSDRKEIIRLDPVTRRVLTRVPLGHPVGVSGVATSADAVWAMVVSNYDIYQSALVRIDPATNRVTARIPLRGTANAVTTAFNAGPVLLTSGDAIWVLGSEGGALFDARRGAVARVVKWNLGGVYGNAYSISGAELWVHADDGRLLRFDARTGARHATVPGTPGLASRLAAIPGGGVVVGHNDGTLMRIDGATGRVLWSTRIGEKSGALTIAGGRLWALGQDRGTERLAAVDLATGRVRSAVALGTAVDDYALTPVGDALWVTTPTGQAVKVSR